MPLPLAEIVAVNNVQPHPNADNLDIITIYSAKEDREHKLVTGQHYRTGIRGIYVRPGTKLPGWFAKDMWLSAKGDKWFSVKEIEMRGIASPGLFCGQEWQKTRDHALEDWPYWQGWFKLGTDVSAYLGVVPA